LAYLIKNGEAWGGYQSVILARLNGSEPSFPACGAAVISSLQRPRPSTVSSESMGSATTARIERSLEQRYRAGADFLAAWTNQGRQLRKRL